MARAQPGAELDAVSHADQGGAEMTSSSLTGLLTNRNHRDVTIDYAGERFARRPPRLRPRGSGRRACRPAHRSRARSASAQSALPYASRVPLRLACALRPGVGAQEGRLRDSGAAREGTGTGEGGGGGCTQRRLLRRATTLGRMAPRRGARSIALLAHAQRASGRVPPGQESWPPLIRRLTSAPPSVPAPRPSLSRRPRGVPPAATCASRSFPRCADLRRRAARLFAAKGAARQGTGGGLRVRAQRGHAPAYTHPRDAEVRSHVRHRHMRHAHGRVWETALLLLLA
jgi:hypothetical protein